MLSETFRYVSLEVQARGARRVELGEPVGCTVLEYDTPLVALVAPNGYKGVRPASASVEDKGMIHKEDRIWQS